MQQLFLLCSCCSLHLSLCGGGAGGVVAKSCLTLATPWTITRQAPLSMGFSRQEYSHCALCAKLLQSCQTLCDPMDGGPPGSLGFPRQEHWSGLPCLPPGDLPYPSFKPTCLMSPALAGRLPLAPPGKPTPVITALHFGLLCSVLIQIPFPHSQAVPCPSMLNYFR